MLKRKPEKRQTIKGDRQQAKPIIPKLPATKRYTLCGLRPFGSAMKST